MTTALARYLSSCERFRSMVLQERITAITFSICHFEAPHKCDPTPPSRHLRIARLRNMTREISKARKGRTRARSRVMPPFLFVPFISRAPAK